MNEEILLVIEIKERTEASYFTSNRVIVAKLFGVALTLFTSLSWVSGASGLISSAPLSFVEQRMRAKKKHAAMIMTQDFTTHSKFKFYNSQEGFEMALERIRMEMVRTGSRGAIFADDLQSRAWKYAISNLR